MAVKPENTFIGSIHRHLPPPKHFHREKMNNPFRGGTADWWYSGDKADLWVEYKYLPKVPAVIRPALSELQKLWLNGRLAEGRNVRVIVGHPKGGVILSDGTWNDGVDSATFMSQTIDRAKIAAFLLSFCMEGNHNDQVSARHLPTNRKRTERI